MNRVSYQFYMTEYEGESIPEQKWKQTMIKAESYLDGMMYTEPDEKTLPKVQFCLCEVAELLYQDEQNKKKTGGRDVLSENTDGYSVTYATEAEAGKIAVNSLDKKVYAIIRRYLDSAGLLYAGV